MTRSTVEVAADVVDGTIRRRCHQRSMGRPRRCTSRRHGSHGVDVSSPQRRSSLSTPSHIDRPGHALHAPAVSESDPRPLVERRAVINVTTMSHVMMSSSSMCGVRPADEQLDELRLHSESRALDREHLLGDDRTFGMSVAATPSAAPFAYISSASSLDGPRFTPSPNTASASRMCATSSRAPAARARTCDAGPGTLVREVKCFSTMQAPSATAATATFGSREWSESPTGTPNVERIVSIERRSSDSGGAGYAPVHCSRMSCSFPVSRNARPLSATSARLAVPGREDHRLALSPRRVAGAAGRPARTTPSCARRRAGRARRPTARRSAEARKATPCSRQCSARRGSHSYGVSISLDHVVIGLVGHPREVVAAAALRG